MHLRARLSISYDQSGMTFRFTCLSSFSSILSHLDDCQECHFIISHPPSPRATGWNSLLYHPFLLPTPHPLAPTFYPSKRIPNATDIDRQTHPKSLFYSFDSLHVTLDRQVTIDALTKKKKKSEKPLYNFPWRFRVSTYFYTTSRCTSNFRD